MFFFEVLLAEFITSLSMFLIFWPLKPYVLKYFVLLKKKDV